MGIDIDWGAIATWGLSGLAFGVGFAFVAYFTVRNLFYEFIAHPTVQAIARAAAALGGKGRGMDGLLRKGASWLMKQFGGGPG